jgi:hypothetical protein
MKSMTLSSREIFKQVGCDVVDDPDGRRDSNNVDAQLDAQLPSEIQGAGVCV